MSVAEALILCPDLPPSAFARVFHGPTQITQLASDETVRLDLRIFGLWRLRVLKVGFFKWKETKLLLCQDALPSAFRCRSFCQTDAAYPNRGFCSLGILSAADSDREAPIDARISHNETPKFGPSW